jgi:hypothetical protein
MIHMHTTKIKIYHSVLKIPYSFLKKVQLLIMQMNNYRKLSFTPTYAHNSDPSGHVYVCEMYKASAIIYNTDTMIKTMLIRS